MATVRSSVGSHWMSAPGGPQVNKFKQVSGLYHQMSLAGGGRARGPRIGGLWDREAPCTKGWGAGPEGVLYGEFQGIMG